MVQQKEMNFEGLRTEYGRRGVFDDRMIRGYHKGASFVATSRLDFTTKMHKLHIKLAFSSVFLKSIPRKRMQMIST